MILGLGVDEIGLERIGRSYERFGDRFLSHCYTDAERAFCFRQRDPVPRLAARYAAKEAASKALGTGLARGIVWREIEVRREPGHKPTLHLHGRARERAEAMGVIRMHVSLTHCRRHAAATVVMEGASERRLSSP